ncbi:MAG: hypothetical protein ABSA75_12650 [Candidatus Bathyarchaeia archaeon]|jgi:hypothetical protein
MSQKKPFVRLAARIRNIVQPMKKRRGKTLLLIALISFIVVLADPISTYFALEKPGFYEANAISRWWLENYGMAGLFLVNLVPFSVFILFFLFGYAVLSYSINQKFHKHKNIANWLVFLFFLIVFVVLMLLKAEVVYGNVRLLLGH